MIIVLTWCVDYEVKVVNPKYKPKRIWKVILAMFAADHMLVANVNK